MSCLFSGPLASEPELESFSPIASLLQNEECFPLSLSTVLVFNLTFAVEETSKQKIATRPFKYYNRDHTRDSFYSVW